MEELQQPAAAEPKKKRPAIVRILRWTLGILLAVVALVAALLTYLTVTEYRPAKTEPAELEAAGAAKAAVETNTPYTALTFNIGYAGLGEESDFFMDGGVLTRPVSANVVQKNLTGIQSTLAAVDADFVLMQEVDRDSKRSYRTDQIALLSAASGQTAAFAPNYVCDFVPYPIPDTLGRVRSGLLTLSGVRLSEQTRVSLPVPFSWPLRIANLKRCLLVSRIPVADSDAELVLINLHLEAYDDGEGKIAQTAQLRELLLSEYAKGNYVIAGGDFNQTLPGGAAEKYPLVDESYWQAGVIEADMLPVGWGILSDDSTPTCRLLNMPFDAADPATQYYVIDGFLCSPNVAAESVRTLGLSFAYSDHNPVLLRFSLIK